jgi:hypothetical protein
MAKLEVYRSVYFYLRVLVGEPLAIDLNVRRSFMALFDGIPLNGHMLPERQAVEAIRGRLQQSGSGPYSLCEARPDDADFRWLEVDETLRAAFKTKSIEFLRRQKLEASIKDAFLSNADEFLNFMSKTETEPAFGKFFFSEMFKWYEENVKAGK